MNTQQSPAIPTNLRLVNDLEFVLDQMLDQHQKLLMHVTTHHAAMMKLDLETMDQTRMVQHSARTRIMLLDKQRIALSQQIARTHKITGNIKLSQLAEIYPTRKASLLRLRTELNSVVTEAARRSFIATKLSTAVLGHLNTAVRILARAVGDVGVYNGRGMATVSKRLGRMEITG
jgi:hypothetical protein